MKDKGISNITNSAITNTSLTSLDVGRDKNYAFSLSLSLSKHFPTDNHIGDEGAKDISELLMTNKTALTSLNLRC